MSEQIKVDLLNAATVLETEGWGQEGYIISGDSEDSTYCYCAGGAILRAVGVPPADIDPDEYRSNREKSDRFDAAMEALGKSLGLAAKVPSNFVNWNLQIPKWNDAEDQTAENVIASIRKAAEELK
ncbi:DUF6197 family protein [Rhodococcus sp. JT-3]|uniref:DUF6197 family protein n=1 Tax=Rhodococcus sp. JT-3 TaxID=1973213 RepID=UPI00130383BF|nr:hypothetical protein [Rhodococcus sp. JT-3]